LPCQFALTPQSDSSPVKQTDQRGLIRRLAEVVKKHGNEDFTCRSGWL
jgi:hypothetical protein